VSPRDPPECIHDGARDFTRRPAGLLESRYVHHPAVAAQQMVALMDHYANPRWETTVRCAECGALLEEVHEEGHPPDRKVRRVCHDEVYELLYTRAGRRRLLREVLGEWGWPIPRAWKEGEP